MPNRKIDINDIVGRTFGKLAVVKYDHQKGVAKTANHYYLCECECGSNCIVLRTNIMNFNTVSCGCHRAKLQKTNGVKHGLFHHPLYSIWKNMKQRCENKNHKSYGDYGGRGICVSEEWSTIEPFYNWAIQNGWSPKLTLERKNNSLGYSSNNCRFATMKEQNRNKRSNVFLTYNGETKTMAQWAEEKNITRSALYLRLKRGWSYEKALSI